jgi:hypothetical protein
VGEACGTCWEGGERRLARRFLTGKPERKRSLGRLRGRWEDIIKMDLQ